MKQIVVNVDGLTIEDKQRVNEALAKIKNIMPCPPMFWGCPMDWESVVILFVTSYDGGKVGFDCCANRSQTHTVRQVLEMAGTAGQGHIHAESMALYAEDAKTTDEPWELWYIDFGSRGTRQLTNHPCWNPKLKYLRKPETKLINGAEVPDISFNPKVNETYWYPSPDYYLTYNSSTVLTDRNKSDIHRAQHGLCYPYTREGKQAAILHSKAMLGIE